MGGGLVFIPRGLCSSSSSPQNVGRHQRHCAAAITVQGRGVPGVIQQWPYGGEACIGTEGRSKSAEDTGPGPEKTASARTAVKSSRTDCCHLYGLFSKPPVPFSLMPPNNGDILDSCTRFFPWKNANWVLPVAVTGWGLGYSGKGCSVHKLEPWEVGRSNLSWST